jgi:hypothetical protein
VAALPFQGALGDERAILQKPFTPDGLVGSVAAALSKASKGGSGVGG